jgi:CotH kinase protein/Fn3 associated
MPIRGFLAAALFCAAVFVVPNASWRPAFAQNAVQPVQFSVEHGFFDTAFSVTLTTTTPGTEIRYTTDFDSPSRITGTIYSAPILVSGTTVLRAIAYSTTTTDTSPVATQTYLFLNQTLAQSNTPGGAWPTIFAANDGKGPYPADYEMDPQVVSHPNYSGTHALPDVLRALPSISIVTDPRHLWDPVSGIYHNQIEEGALWERPISVEWIDPTGVSRGFSERAGMRIHGNSSRRPYRTPKKSFRLVFGSAYGNSSLNFRVFDDPAAVGKFERLVLRGGSNYSWLRNDRDQRRKTDFIADEFARRTWLEMGGLASRGGWVHVYLNGLYWGMYNILERMDERFLAANRGGVRADYDMIEPDDDADPVVISTVVGDLKAWNTLTATVESVPVSAAAYAQAKQLIDVVDLADYMILMHTVGNTDWPEHNWYAYRKRSGADTRFRIIPWDTETSLQQLDENVTTGDFPGSPARIYLRLLTNPDFRQMVADRLYWHLQRADGKLTPAACATRIATLAALIDKPIISESARWGDYARDVYSDTTALKGAPAYLYSRDLPHAFTDPSGMVSDDEQLTWLQNIDTRLTVYCPQRPAKLIGQYVANGWVTTTLNPPAILAVSGPISGTEPISVDVSNAPNTGAGELVVSLNGDPRAEGGGIAPYALTGDDLLSVPIVYTSTLSARVKLGGVWSPLEFVTIARPQIAPYEKRLWLPVLGNR